jgi:hypothetical protein
MPVIERGLCTGVRFAGRTWMDFESIAASGQSDSTASGFPLSSRWSPPTHARCLPALPPPAASLAMCIDVGAVKLSVGRPRIPYAGAPPTTARTEPALQPCFCCCGKSALYYEDFVLCSVCPGMFATEVQYFLCSELNKFVV